MTDTAVQAQPDISQQVRSICDALGLRYDLVASLRIRPGSVSATVYLLDENGSKHVVASHPDQHTHLFKVTT